MLLAWFDFFTCVVHQEVTPDIYDIFKRSVWWDVYHCSVSSEKAHSRPYFCMQVNFIYILHL
jgi:tyrosyl-DNA phosphodiesterase 2